MKVCLVGDSIFDNDHYVGNDRNVIEHLTSLASGLGWEPPILRARDGAVCTEVPSQLRDMPKTVTHIVVSIGGNDALGNRHLLATPVRSTTEALALFGRGVGTFEADYRRAVASVFALGQPVTLCTIYNGNLPEPEAAIARVALMLFNDVIVRVALEHAAGLIDLRQVCTEAGDYANPIEPSGRGGFKIAQAITRAVSCTETMETT